LHTADTATQYYSEESTPQIISLHAGLDSATFGDSHDSTELEFTELYTVTACHRLAESTLQQLIHQCVADYDFL